MEAVRAIRAHCTEPEPYARLPEQRYLLPTVRPAISSTGRAGIVEKYMGKIERGKYLVQHNFI